MILRTIVFFVYFQVDILLVKEEHDVTKYTVDTSIYNVHELILFFHIYVRRRWTAMSRHRQEICRQRVLWLDSTLFRFDFACLLFYSFIINIIIINFITIRGLFHQLSLSTSRSQDNFYKKIYKWQFISIVITWYKLDKMMHIYTLCDSYLKG